LEAGDQVTLRRGPVWLEVALNGPWARERQPLIPVAEEEIVADGIACARAGAAVVHLHAYDPASGRQRDDPAIYARIVEGIRAEVDAVVYPTVPLAGSADAPDAGPAAARYAAVEELARRGLIEWAVVDPGSTQMSFRADLERDREGFVYLNPESHVRHGLALCARHGLVPSYAVYEPGFLRLGAALARRAASGAPSPLYRFMFTEDLTFGYPPAGFALAAYLELLAREAGPEAPWMVAGLGVDVRPLIPTAVAAGGHVRVGLEDAPLGTRMTNLDWVEAAKGLIVGAGGRLASPAEVRAATGGRSRWAGTTS
jgi:3-keto-5-aminohexanoate cleavage enzyme